LTPSYIVNEWNEWWLLICETADVFST